MSFSNIPHENLALEKSISGCASMNDFSLSCFSYSSLVGNPFCFCCWSYIIFSTVVRVSASKSPSLEFSGSTFCVSISISPFKKLFHHVLPLIFSSVKFMVHLSPSRSMFQKLSDGLTGSYHLPSTIGSSALPFTLILKANF